MTILEADAGADKRHRTGTIRFDRSRAAAHDGSAIENYDLAGVETVIASLERIEREASKHEPLGRNDGVACFDFLYTIITKHVLACCQAAPGSTPTFQDPDFMACLDVAFANRYLAAVGEGGPQPFQPRCWQTLVAHRETADISPLIFAVAGVNAHVNFDLPFALVTASEHSRRELDSGANHADYQAINQIFALHMRQLRHHFEDRFAREFDTSIISAVENLLGDLIVVAARDLAWRKAKQLWKVRDDTTAMVRLARSRDRRVSAINNALFALDRNLCRAFRALEIIPGPTRRAARKALTRTGQAVAANPPPTA